MMGLTLIKRMHLTQQVKRLLAKGYTNLQIMEDLNISQVTLKGFQKIIKAELRAETGKGRFEEVLISLKDNQNAVVQELWRMVEQTNIKNRDKLTALNSVIKVLTDMVGVYQRLGIIEKAPDKLEISGVDSIREKLAIAYKETKRLKEQEYEQLTGAVASEEILFKKEGEVK